MSKILCWLYLFLFVAALPVCAQGKKPPMPSPAPFSDIVWKVKTSRQIQAGQIYVFLSDGTLVITSKNSLAALGYWNYKNGALTMTEEGITRKVRILRRTPTEFRIRIEEPKSPVEMTLVRVR